MNRPQIKRLFLLLFILSFTILVIPKRSRSEKIVYTSEDPIVIIGNEMWESFLTEPWCSGNGTKDDPYIIENIDTTQLRIENSDVYFIVRNSFSLKLA